MINFSPLSPIFLAEYKLEALGALSQGNPLLVYEAYNYMIIKQHISVDPESSKLKHSF